MRLQTHRGKSRSRTACGRASPTQLGSTMSQAAVEKQQQKQKRHEQEGQRQEKQAPQDDSVTLVPVSGDQVLPLPLDRGYAWVVTFACMMNSFIVDGVANSFGLLLTDFCEHFEADKSSVTLMGSLLCGVYLLTGPVTGALVNKFGCRAVCIAGGVVSCVAFVGSSFATSLAVLTFFYGVLGGIGFGFVYLPSMVCVNFYFERYRPLAMGLAVCGTGIGTIVLGPVTNALLLSMGWQNTLMIMAGIVLHGSVFGALMRPNTPPTPQLPGNKGDAIGAMAEQYVKRGRAETDEPMAALVRRANSDKKIFASAASGLKADGGFDAVMRSLPSVAMKRPAAKKSKFDVDALRSGVTSAAIDDLQRPLYRKDIFYSGSVMNLGGKQVQKSQKSPSLLLLSMTRIPGEIDEVASIAPARCLRCLPKPIVDAFLMMTDFSIMKQPSFAIIWAGNLVTMLAFYVPLFFVSDFSREIGVSPGQSRYLNSAFGAANTIARIVVGLLAGHPSVSPIFVNNMSILLSGVFVALLVPCSGFWSLVCVYTLLGITLAPVITLTSEILCSLVGLDNLTSAFGMITLARGISTCVGGPLTASLYNDATKYTLPFLVGGVLFVVGSSVFNILFLPTFRKKRERTRSEVEQAIRSVQNLSASLVLVEGTQQLLASSSVDLSAIAQRRAAGSDAPDTQQPDEFFEETV